MDFILGILPFLIGFAFGWLLEKHTDKILERNGKEFEERRRANDQDEQLGS